MASSTAHQFRFPHKHTRSRTHTHTAISLCPFYWFLAWLPHVSEYAAILRIHEYAHIAAADSAEYGSHEGSHRAYIELGGRVKHTNSDLMLSRNCVALYNIRVLLASAFYHHRSRSRPPSAVLVPLSKTMLSNRRTSCMRA